MKLMKKYCLKLMDLLEAQAKVQYGHAMMS